MRRRPGPRSGAMAQPRLPWAAPAEHGTVAADTLFLPPAEHLLPPAGRRRHRAARHRRRRAGAADGRRSAIALTSVAVVAVIVIAVAVAVTGAIPGSIGQMMSFGGHPAQRRLVDGADRAGDSPSLEGAGGASPSAPSAAVTGTPSVSPSATTGPGTLCREFYESFSPAELGGAGRPVQGTGQARGRSRPDFHLLLPLPELLGQGASGRTRPSGRRLPRRVRGQGTGLPGTGNTARERGAGSAGAGNAGAGSAGAGNAGTGSAGAGSAARDRAETRRQWQPERSGDPGPSAGPGASAGAQGAERRPGLRTAPPRGLRTAP